ncbi:helix-turn-helix domain-containing protein [Dyadobacter sp. CY261]|uniref:helix-turn-helix domain-containing protein n=1 Tax=Dyadobacter sp. CY261 TaxID=2907203 RepID=UPI001F3B4A7C|nr:helix-turn-helix domain-containing protein [Dyadobacter sp. CY261]MCF0069552.1 helix-turn-helix domain-containing protein [Dyadobacter sp. CY261]
MNSTPTKPGPTFQVYSLEGYFSGSGRRHHYDQQEVFELYWIHRGSALLSLDLEKRRIQDNTMYCVFPGQICRIEPEGKLTGYKVLFSRDFLCCGSSLSLLPGSLDYTGLDKKIPIMTLGDQVRNEIEEIFRTILWEYGNDYENKTDILHGLLTLLISYFSHSDVLVEPDHIVTNQKIVFNKFLGKIENCYRTEKQVSFYASELALTPSYLTELVKKVSGSSARYHIQQRVLLEAKRKALLTNMQVKDIAFELGFDDPSTFSKFFKVLTGSSFSEFRNADIEILQ